MNFFILATYLAIHNLLKNGEVAAWMNLPGDRVRLILLKGKSFVLNL